MLETMSDTQKAVFAQGVLTVKDQQRQEAELKATQAENVADTAKYGLQGPPPGGPVGPVKPPSRERRGRAPVRVS